MCGACKSKRALVLGNIDRLHRTSSETLKKQLSFISLLLLLLLLFYFDGASKIAKESDYDISDFAISQTKYGLIKESYR